MEVSVKGVCKECKHCAVFNHKENLALCTEYYNMKDVPRGSICFEAGSRIVLDCDGFEEQKRRAKHE